VIDCKDLKNNTILGTIIVLVTATSIISFIASAASGQKPPWDNSPPINEGPTDDGEPPEDDDGFINDRARELATRPSRVLEGNTGARLEEQLGTQLRIHNDRVYPEDYYTTGDWVDSSGTTYDAVSPSSDYFNIARVEESIQEHFNKFGVDYIVIDTTPLTATQAEQVRDAAGNYQWGLNESGRQHPDLMWVP